MCGCSPAESRLGSSKGRSPCLLDQRSVLGRCTLFSSATVGSTATHRVFPPSSLFSEDSPARASTPQRHFALGFHLATAPSLPTCHPHGPTSLIAFINLLRSPSNSQLNRNHIPYTVAVASSHPGSIITITLHQLPSHPSSSERKNSSPNCDPGKFFTPSLPLRRKDGTGRGRC